VPYHAVEKPPVFTTVFLLPLWLADFLQTDKHLFLFVTKKNQRNWRKSARFIAKLKLF
jgi:hypothetical protein